MIVSEMAGTTRDAIDTELLVGEREVVLIDRAGLRKRSKWRGRLTSRPAPIGARGRARRRGDRVCDASEGLTSEDLRVAELAMKTDCATVLRSTSGT